MKRILILVTSAIAAVVVVSAALAQTFSPWSAPASAESIPGTSSELNTPSQDGCPILSPDGLSLYMASNRPGGLGGLDIWVAKRESKNAPFGAPTNAGAPINTAQDDFCPSPMEGGWFFFVSTRPGGCGDADIYVTRRVGDGWWQPLHLGCKVNSAGQEASPYLLTHKNGRVLLYFSSNRAGGFAPDTATPDADIYVSQLTLFGFSAAQLVPGLNTDKNDARPNLSSDGLEIVFDSDRPGTLGGPDLYYRAPGQGHRPVVDPHQPRRPDQQPGGREPGIALLGRARPFTSGAPGPGSREPPTSSSRPGRRLREIELSHDDS